MEIDKSKFKDEKGRYIVQGLFLEDKYDPDMAVFTFDGEDKVYKGKTFISLKKRYIAHSDPIQYDFATTWLFDWPHWQRLKKNVVVSRHIETWEEELNLKLMSDGVQLLVQMAEEGKSYQAAKYLTDHQWNKEGAGRPSKDRVEGELQRRADLAAEHQSDLVLLENHRSK